jgi:hypothetical protein
MRPRRPRRPLDAQPFYAAMLKIGGAYALWCHRDHAVRASQMPDGLRRQTVWFYEPLGLGRLLVAWGWEPRSVHFLSPAQLRALLDTSWEASHLRTPDVRVPVALIASSRADSAAALYDAGDPLWPGEPALAPLAAQEGGDEAA